MRGFLLLIFVKELLLNCSVEVVPQEMGGADVSDEGAVTRREGRLETAVSSRHEGRVETVSTGQDEVHVVP